MPDEAPGCPDQICVAIPHMRPGDCPLSSWLADEDLRVPGVPSPQLRRPIECAPPGLPGVVVSRHPDPARPGVPKTGMGRPAPANRCAPRACPSPRCPAEQRVRRPGCPIYPCLARPLLRPRAAPNPPAWPHNACAPGCPGDVCIARRHTRPGCPCRSVSPKLGAPRGALRSSVRQLSPAPPGCPTVICSPQRTCAPRVPIPGMFRRQRGCAPGCPFPTCVPKELLRPQGDSAKGGRRRWISI